MDLLISPDYLEKYFSLIHKDQRDEVELICYLSIQNRHNNFLLSKKLLEFYENTFESTEYIDLFQAYITEVIDGRMIQCSGCNNEKLEVLLSDMESHYLQKLKIAKSSIYISLSKSKAQSLNNIRSAILDFYNDKKHRLLLELVAYNPREITFRYHDFSTNEEIQELFDIYFNIVNTYDEVCIIDRQSNIQHSLFDSIKDTKRICYYTQTRNRVDEVEENKKLRDHFNSCRVFRLRRDNTHERKIQIKDFIMEVDEDFQNLDIARETWKISFLLNEKEGEILDKRRMQFTRDAK